MSTFEQKTVAKQLYRKISPWQTRILRLEPALHPHRPVFCRLQAADITAWEGLGIIDDGKEREISFEALSYEWGSPDFTEIVTVNDLKYPVTQNLLSALQHLRDSSRPRYLWVDALCTNQHDDFEKAIQVRRMFVIYRKAERVIAWVPNWSEEMAASLQSLLAEPTSVEQMDRQRQEEAHKILADAYYPSLLKRTWIRQEFFAAQAIMFQYGNLNLSWDQYSKLGDIIAVIQILNPEICNRDQEVRRLDANSLRFPDRAADGLICRMQERFADRPTGNDPWTPSNSVSLLGALIISSQFQVTDDRDLVYGVIGLTNILTTTTHQEPAIEKPRLTIDYTIQVHEVFTNAALYLISSMRSLAILDFAGSELRPNLSIPSWVPDWRFVDPEMAESRVSRQTDNWRYGTVDTSDWDDNSHQWQPDLHLRAPPSVLSASGIVLAHLIPPDPNGSVWESFTSPKLVESFLEKYGENVPTSWPGKLARFAEMFPTSGMDQRLAFYERFNDEPWDSPLWNGRVQATQPSEAGVQVFSQLQEEMFETWYTENTRGGRPFPGFPATPMVFPTTSVAAVPPNAVHNDLIVLLEGAPYPFVLRPNTNGEGFIFIGRSLYPLWFEHASNDSLLPSQQSISDYSSHAWSCVIRSLNLGQKELFNIV
ncbi:hypothetical protein JX266_005143 [Neoarthrinium moseri]|nr:hypothetical protein JX266_005143 [Neoarthrinium moseri]